MENIIISSENLSRQFKAGPVTINALNKVSFAGRIIRLKDGIIESDTLNN